MYKKIVIGVLSIALMLGFISYFYYQIKLQESFNIGSEVLYTREIPTQPRLFFHGSPNRNIEIFEPRSMYQRDSREGDVVFSTPAIGFAAVFMTTHDKSR